MTGLPTVVSFAAGAEYYFQCAQALRWDCERVGLRYEIRELPAVDLEWPEICRLKVAFLQEMQAKHGAILWVDVDSSIVRLSDIISNSGFDIAGYAGRLNYIRDYDPYSSARFWVPSILYFGNTRNASKFLEQMVAIESSTKKNVTDDWVLQETWARHAFEMSTGFFPPSTVSRKGEEVNEDTVFLLGDSGNVPKYREHVAQHEKRGMDKRLRSKFISNEAQLLMRGRRKCDALFFSRRAYEIDPDYEPNILQLSRYLSLAESKDASLEFLRSLVYSGRGGPRVVEELAVRCQQAGNFDEARLRFRELMLLGDTDFSPRAESQLFELSLDEKASVLGISQAERLRMWWERRPYPGDVAVGISLWVIEKIIGAPPIFGPRSSSLLSAGVSAGAATGNSAVWGSGIISKGDLVQSGVEYRAVRGPITRDAVRRVAGECPEIYGEPALLLPLFYTPSLPRPGHRLGFVRHVLHQGRNFSFNGVKDISLIGVGEEAVKRVVDEISDCEAILTTSLQGLAIANAYGIPARWCVFSDENSRGVGDGSDFLDYFDAFGIERQTPLDISPYKVLSEDLVNFVPKLHSIQFDAESFIGALRA